jgi:hypothetical protein
MTRSTLFCSFCGKSEHEVKKLIAGPNVFVCDGCVRLCAEMVDQEEWPPIDPELRKWAWHEAALALSSGQPTIAQMVEFADAGVAYASPARLIPSQADRNPKGQDREDGLGAQHESGGAEGMRQEPSA